VLGAIIGGAVGGTQGKKVHAATVPDNPINSGGQSGASGDLQPTSTIPSSSKAGNPQSPASTKGVDLIAPASWQELGSPA
jgi:hypothetical protein